MDKEEWRSIAIRIKGEVGSRECCLLTKKAREPSYRGVCKCVTDAQLPSGIALELSQYSHDTK